MINFETESPTKNIYTEIFYTFQSMLYIVELSLFDYLSEIFAVPITYYTAND